MSEAERPALGILELALIARGVVVSDAVVKRAPVALLASRPVSGGKHLVIFRGEVAEVEESMAAGLERAGDAIIDRLLLSYAEPQLWPLVPAPVRASGWEREAGSESVAVVETTTVCAAVEAADAAAKAAEVLLRDMQLAIGIAGKAFFTMTGVLHDVEAAAEAAHAAASDRLAAIEIVPAPAVDIRGRLIF